MYILIYIFLWYQTLGWTVVTIFIGSDKTHGWSFSFFKQQLFLDGWKGVVRWEGFSLTWFPLILYVLFKRPKKISVSKMKSESSDDENPQLNLFPDSQ